MVKPRMLISYILVSFVKSIMQILLSCFSLSHTMVRVFLRLEHELSITTRLGLLPSSAVWTITGIASHAMKTVVEAVVV